MGTPKSQPNTDPSKPLDNLHAEAFCLALAKGGVANAAYVEAYPAARKWKPATVRSESSRLAALPQVKARIEWLRKQAANVAILSLIEVKEALTRMARGEEVEFSDTAIQGGIIAKLGKSNKLGAIALLTRLEGWEKPQKIEHSSVVEIVRHDDGRG